MQKTGSTTLETITEWLITHEDDSIEADVEPSAAPCVSDEQSENVDHTPVSLVAKSFQCDDCGKLFKTPEEVEFHASKSGIT